MVNNKKKCLEENGMRKQKNKNGLNQVKIENVEE